MEKLEWILGAGHVYNFAYVVMLSAAHDILKKQETHNSTASASSGHGLLSGNSSSNSSLYDCNPTSTAAVLLADILPTLFIKMSAPFFIHKVPYERSCFRFRVLLCALTAAASFLVVSFSSALWMSFLGVVLASISAGLGELSFLALTVYFSRDVVGGWSSDGRHSTGHTAHHARRTRRHVAKLLRPAGPSLRSAQWRTSDSDPRSTGQCPEETRGLMDSAEEEDDSDDKTTASATGSRASEPLSFSEKLLVMKGLLRFVLPLGLVYFAEYFINQGLMELLYFPGSFLSHAEQYRWYQTLYQIGVFVSRSSLCCFKVRKLWIFPVLQVLNVLFLTLAVALRFLPSAWIVFGIVLYEGLLGGGAYVNTFYFISKETELPVPGVRHGSGLCGRHYGHQSVCSAVLPCPQVLLLPLT
ncbi:hypothetical protein WMY93_001683 [Mugilogobius chulae]|uniref:Battenin n=1 Tax=Mugilogobius chulae TaxID=88201 RepID=A0AAW0PUV0_9GOBI